MSFATTRPGIILADGRPKHKPSSGVAQWYLLPIVLVTLRVTQAPHAEREQYVFQRTTTSGVESFSFERLCSPLPAGQSSCRLNSVVRVSRRWPDSRSSRP
jgi:hypothetical protein